MEPIFEQYDEENLEHQDPIYAISQWQEFGGFWWNGCVEWEELNEKEKAA